MNTIRLAHLIIAALGLTAISTVGCAEKAKSSESSLPVVQAADASPASNPVAGPTTPIQVPVTVNPDVASAQWVDIKDVTYDLRARFFAGLKRLETKVENQVGELTAKRAAMNSTANTQDWDFAMKEMGDAQTYLTSMGIELSKASPETWDQVKDKVGKAWVRTQDAFAKVKSSTTVR